jgi:hypothetical protein
MNRQERQGALPLGAVGAIATVGLALRAETLFFFAGFAALPEIFQRSSCANWYSSRLSTLATWRFVHNR